MEPERKRRRFEEPFLQGIIGVLGNEVKEKVFSVLDAKNEKIKKNEHLIAKLAERNEEKSDKIEEMKKDHDKILCLLTEIRFKYDEQAKEKETMRFENNVLVVEVERLKELLETTQKMEQSDKITEPRKEEVNNEPECSAPTLKETNFNQETIIDNLKHEVAKLGIKKQRAQKNVDTAMQRIENNLKKITNLQLTNEIFETQLKEKDGNIKELKKIIVETEEKTAIMNRAKFKVHHITNENFQRAQKIIESIAEEGQKLEDIKKSIGTSQAEKEELETKVKHLEVKLANNIVISDTKRKNEEIRRQNEEKDLYEEEIRRELASHSYRTIPCNNGDRCTYGSRCKFYHEERWLQREEWGEGQ